MSKNVLNGCKTNKRKKQNIRIQNLNSFILQHIGVCLSGKC
jgi:hypothetical protein